MGSQENSGERVYRGTGAAGGVVHARLLLLGQPHRDIPHRSIGAEETGSELKRFQQALVETRHQIQDIQRRVTAAMGAAEGGIFDAHLMTLDDPTIVDEVTRGIRDKRVNAEHVVQQVIQRYASALAAVEDEYLRERAADIRDIGSRLLNNLMGVAGESELSRLTEPVVIIAHDLAPSVTAVLDRSKVLGFATDAGGVTSHTAIMARKLKIPAVVGLGNVTHQVYSGEYALLDGHGGSLVINPTDATLFQYGQMRERRAAFDERLRDLRDQLAVTFDGHRITLAANIDEPGDYIDAKKSGAEGVGLFRTEFLFLKASEPPDEDTQYAAYRAVAEQAAPAGVVIRTLDLGGDKMFPDSSREANPFLGWRAIRISLTNPEQFRIQLRAVLRASAHGVVKLMYPMISSLDELLEANRILEECRGELRKLGQKFDEQMEVGMMIEIPSAALIADRLAPHVDFFSLGTNDLTQYTLAVDRLNERVAHLHQPGHPAILRLIQLTVEAARPHGCWVGVCGEAAGDPAYIPLFIGLGVDELSATPAVIPEAKFLVRRLKLSEAKALAAAALQCSRAEEVRALSVAVSKKAAPELFPNGTN